VTKRLFPVTNHEQQDTRGEQQAAYDWRDGNGLAFLPGRFNRTDVEHRLLARPRNPAPEKRNEPEDDEQNSDDLSRSHIRLLPLDHRVTGA
jgi:hypothetical protein